MNHNLREFLSYVSSRHALVMFNICLICVCFAFKPVSLDSPVDLTFNETTGSIRGNF